MGAKTLKARKVCKAFKGRTVVSSVDLDVHMGEIVGLLGPNGAGKTTTFYMIVGLIKPDSGRVMIDSKDITPFPMFRRARIGVGYLPQEASIFRNLTVKENIEIVLQELGKPQRNRNHGLPYPGRIRANISCFYSWVCAQRRRAKAGGNSRCLSIMPDFLLLDEPFCGIDLSQSRHPADHSEPSGKGYGILLTDHNVRDTLAITDRTYLIHQGEIVIEGSPDEVAQSEVARKFYLGDRFSW